MSGYSRYIARVVCLLCIFCLFFAGMNLKQKNTFYDNYVTILNTSGAYGDDTVKNVENTEEAMEKKYIMNYTFWGEVQKQQIGDKDNLRHTDVTVIALWGTSEQIIPYGKKFQKEETTGCLIGTKAAEKVFGTRLAEGLYIQYNDQTFQVRGVVDIQEPVLIVQKQENMTGILNRITVRKRTGENVQETLQKFTSAYGVSGEALRFDFYRSPVWMLEVIPGKWSDFAGWKQNIQSYQKKWVLLGSAQKGIMEFLYEKQVRKEVLCFLFAGAGMVVLLWSEGKYYIHRKQHFVGKVYHK